MYRCIKPDAKELYDSDPQKHIELCGRICYKSEDRITEESNKKFISDMHGRNHWAMLEHFRFIAIVPPHIHGFIKSIGSPYIVTTVDEITHDNGERDLRHMVSASARALMDAVTEVEEWRDNGLDGDKQSVLVALMAFIKHIVYHYGCSELFGGQYSPCQQYNISIVERDELRNGKFTQYEIFRHEWHTVLFTVDRGITHEFVRHRPCSFAQESTRYCNYSLGKFDSSIGVVRPFEFKDGTEGYVLWEKCMHYINEMYQQMARAGIKPQWARSILPQSTKADLVITTNNKEWQHIVNLRYLATTGAPHPQIVEVMSILVDENQWAKEMSGK